MYSLPEPKPEEIRERIDKIREQMQCPRSFRCIDQGLCKAKDILMDNYLECLEPKPVACKFAHSFGEVYLCRCPLRVYLMKTLGT